MKQTECPVTVCGERTVLYYLTHPTKYKKKRLKLKLRPGKKCVIWFSPFSTRLGPAGNRCRIGVSSSQVYGDLAPVKWKGAQTGGLGDEGPGRRSPGCPRGMVFLEHRGEVVQSTGDGPRGAHARRGAGRRAVTPSTFSPTAPPPRGVLPAPDRTRADASPHRTRERVAQRGFRLRDGAEDGQVAPSRAGDGPAQRPSYADHGHGRPGHHVSCAASQPDFRLK